MKTRLYVQSGGSPDGITLTIEDDISGTVLARFHLDAAQAFNLMGGATLHVDGEISGHLDRVGKRMIHESYLVPREITSPAKYDEMADIGEAWARETYPGWETYAARRTNTGGVRVVVRKWVEA